jgi:hypothetical protein
VDSESKIHPFPFDRYVVTQIKHQQCLFGSVITMINKEDENDNEVRWEDQDRINKFARLNARRQENKVEREQIKVCRCPLYLSQT